MSAEIDFRRPLTGCTAALACQQAHRTCTSAVNLARQRFFIIVVDKRGW